MAIKDVHIIELRDQIFKLLIQNETKYHKTVVERLSMCIGLIALNSTNTAWPTSIPDILNFARVHGPRECFIGLNILKNISVILNQNVFTARQTSLIKRWIREGAS